MLRIITVFLILISCPSFAQQVSGTVTDDEGNPLAATLIFNMKTEQKAYSNVNGQFSINASVNEELRFIRAGYERNSKITEQSDFSKPLKMIIVRDIQEIEEVIVPTVKLTGDLNADSRNLGRYSKVAQLQQDIGVPTTPENPRETPPPTLEKAGAIKYALSNLNVFTLYKNISGDARRMRSLYKFEDIQSDISWIRERIEDDYFTTVGIPIEKINEFLQYSIGTKPDINKYIKAQNLSKVLFILEETFPKYLSR